MITSIVILYLLVLLMFIAVVAQLEFIYRHAVFILLLVLFLIMLALCCKRRKFSLKHLGFFTCHGGVIIILLGAWIGYFHSQTADIHVPVNAMHDVFLREFPIDSQGRDYFRLPFGIKAKDFNVDFYDPVFRLFKPVPEKQEYDFVKEVRLGADDILDLGEYGLYTRAQLRDPTDADWLPFVSLTNEWVIQPHRGMPRHYEALLRFSGVNEDLPLEVNKPITHKGWRFYLMSYQEHHGFVFLLLSVRKDPGRGAVIAGIWVLMIGTAVVCFRKLGDGS